MKRCCKLFLGKYLIPLAGILLLMSCGYSQKATTKSLTGRWQITDWQIPDMLPEDTIMQRMIHEAGTGPDKFGYMEFMPDGRLSMSIMGQSETISYKIAGDTLFINNIAGEPNEPLFVAFDGNDGALIKTFNNDKVYTLRRASPKN